MESTEELAKTATVTPGGFPESPQKGSSSKTTVAVPAGDPDSSSSSSVSDDMSNHGNKAGEAGGTPAPVPEALPRLNIKVPSPKKFTGVAEVLKPEAFDRWYNSVKLYLRFQRVAQNVPGSGNYWIIYTEAPAQEAAFQVAETFEENLTRDELILYLREGFQSSKYMDDTY